MTTIRRVTGETLDVVRENIKRALFERRWSMRKLERMADVGRSNVYDVVRGYKDSLSFETLEKIAVALDVTAEALMRAGADVKPVVPKNDEKEKSRGPFVSIGPLREVTAILRTFDTEQRFAFAEVETADGPVGRHMIIIDPALAIDPGPFARAFFGRQRLRMAVKTAADAEGEETLFVMDARPSD